MKVKQTGNEMMNQDKLCVLDDPIVAHDCTSRAQKALTHFKIVSSTRIKSEGVARNGKQKEEEEANTVTDERIKDDRPGRVI